jgi:hypothetical protein
LRFNTPFLRKTGNCVLSEVSTAGSSLPTHAHISSCKANFAFRSLDLCSHFRPEKRGRLVTSSRPRGSMRQFKPGSQGRQQRFSGLKVTADLGARALVAARHADPFRGPLTGGRTRRTHAPSRVLLPRPVTRTCAECWRPRNLQIQPPLHLPRRDTLYSLF